MTFKGHRTGGKMKDAKQGSGVKIVVGDPCTIQFWTDPLFKGSLDLNSFYTGIEQFAFIQFDSFASFAEKS